jgi:hypothetical protein
MDQGFVSLETVKYINMPLGKDLYLSQYLAPGAAPINDPNFGVVYKRPTWAEADAMGLPMSPIARMLRQRGKQGDYYRPIFGSDEAVARGLSYGPANEGGGGLRGWLNSNVDWIVPAVLAVMGGYAVAGASGLVAAEAAPALEGVAMTGEAAVVATEAAPLAASEFSLAGSGSGLGIGGQGYGLGLSVPAGAPGAVVSEFSLAGGLSGYGLSGNALLTAPTLASSGLTLADVLKQGEGIKSAASQVLSLGRAVRSAFGAEGGAPGGGPVFAPAADTAASDAAWTLGTLVAVVAAAFLYSKVS